ncbi:MAG: hypothetical protein OXF41_20760 [bacterium]|nr:hypothetical protein [bacterium]
MSIGEVLVGDAGECVGVPQQRFGLGAPFVDECRAGAVGSGQVEDRVAVATVKVWAL